jgi:hypothetical protein
MYRCSRSKERSRTTWILHMFRFRSTQSSWALLTKVGELCAVVCMSFGITLAAILDISFDQRIRSLLLLGLLPAAGFYVGGHALFHLRMIDREQREEIVYFLGHGYQYVSRRLAKVPELGQKTCGLVLLCYSYLHRSIFELSCLAIRSAAQLLLRIQSQAGLGRDESCDAHPVRLAAREHSGPRPLG